MTTAPGDRRAASADVADDRAPRIAEVRTLKVDGAWRNWVFVRVATDGGHVGYGECTLEGRERAVEGAIEDFQRVLLGRDASRIRELVHLMTRHGYWESGPVISSAAGGVEMALWDLAGKRLGVPVHTLLGGAIRDTARVYSNAWYFGAETPADFADAARSTVALGYRALKFDPFGACEFTITPDELHAAVAGVAAVRKAVGPEIDLLIEAHGRFSVPSAIRVVHAIEPFDVLLLEEPVAAGDVEGLGAVARAAAIPIAAGERCYEPRDYLRLIDAGASVLQPDVIHAGGILQTLLIAGIAQARSVAIAPHNASGPIATAATLQVAAAIPNLLIQEMFAPTDASWKADVVHPPIAIADGHVSIPTRPGLGVELDEGEAARHPFTPRDLELFADGSILNRPIQPSAQESSPRVRQVARDG